MDKGSLGVNVEARIRMAKEIITRYGPPLSLRQIYYVMKPKEPSYRRVEYALKIARRRGIIDYEDIVDRSRNVYAYRTWDSRDSFIEDIPGIFQLDYWADSDVRPEIWTEKDAISEVLYSVSWPLYHIPVRVTGGFLSLSNKHRWHREGLVILYFGDYDPSGLCMDEDLSNEELLEGTPLERIALTREQAEGLGKGVSISISNKANNRISKRYIQETGLDYGWEIDALSPDILRSLVKQAIERHITFDLELKKREEREIIESLE